MSRHGFVAAVLAGIAGVLAVAGTALVVAGGVGATPGTGELAMNLVVAATFPAAAAAIARRRPGHVLAWVYSVVGLGSGLSLFTYGYARHALELSPGSLPFGVAVGWVSSWVWTTGVVPLVTLGVLLYPDGRLPSPRWRPVAGGAVGSVMLLATAHALRPGPLVNHPVVGNPLGIPGAGPFLDGVGLAGFGLFGVVFVACAGSLLVRWRRGERAERRQLRWLLYAVVVLLVGFLVDTTLASPATSLAAAAALAFLPLAVGIAITREHLYDINVLISRSLSYAALTAGLVAAYIVVVAAVGGLLGARAGIVGPLLATGFVAVLFQPARELLQRRVARLVYGGQADPYASLADLGRLKATLEPHAVLPAVVRTIAGTLRLPYVAIEVDEGGEVRRPAAWGAPTGHETSLVLTHHDEVIGRLVLGQRSASESLTRRERRLLEDIARQVGVAVHTVRLTAALQRSREALVVAREEERRRLHRDLHDGLGPTLAAMALQLDVLRRQIPAEAAVAHDLTEHLRAALHKAIPDIRRLIEGLRPPALDELGLLAALREQALALTTRTETGEGLTVTVSADGDLPPLGAATAVAAYRIATEAVTNAARHAGARHCHVRVRCNGALEIDVEDDGAGIPSGAPPGVGLHSMRERAAELGGFCSIEPGEGGGTRVHAQLPLRSP